MDGLPADPIDTGSVTSVLRPPVPAVPEIPKAPTSNLPPSPVIPTPKVEVAKPKPQPLVSSPTLPPPPPPTKLQPPKKKHRWFLVGCLGILLSIVIGVVTIFVLALTSPTGELVLDSADLMPMLIRHASPSASPSAKEATPSDTEAPVKVATPSAFEGLLD